MEKIAYALLLTVAIVWIILITTGAIIAFPFGILWLMGIVGIGLIFIKVLKEKLNNQEDKYYEDNIDQ